MTPGWNRVVSSLFWLGAALWPLDLLQYVPGLGISLLSLVALLLLPPLILDAAAQGKLKVPFEILAPAAAILLLTGLDVALHGAYDGSGEIVSALILLMSLAHFAPPRDAIRKYLLVSLISGFAVTLLTLVAPLAGLIPTAFSWRSGVAFTFAYTVPGAAHILLLIAAVAAFAVRERRYPPAVRALATVSIVFLATALTGEAIHWVRDTQALPIARYPRLNTVQLGSAAVALWLVARILSKSLVNSRSSPDPVHGLIWSAALVTLAVAACAPLLPGAYQGFVAGLACAAVLPSREWVAPDRRVFVLAAIPAVLCVANLAVVSPGNVRDARQYDAVSQRDFDAGRFRQILTRMDTIERHAPNERRTHLWRARTALARGLPNWASYEFAAAVKTAPGTTLLEPPTDEDRQAFLVHVRDLVASMPESQSVGAFERTLLAMGQRDSALYSLRLETAVALTHVESVDPMPYATAVALVLGDDSLAGDLEFWSPDELITLLMLWGARLEDSYEVPDRRSPQVLLAQRSLNGLDVFVAFPTHMQRVHCNLEPPGASGLDSLISAHAMRWSAARAGSGATRYTLIVNRDSGEDEVGSLEILADGRVKFELDAERAVIPFIPAIWLRRGP